MRGFGIISFILFLLLSSDMSFSTELLKFKKEDTKLFNFSDVTSKLFQPGPGSRPCCAFGTDIHFRYFPLIIIDQVIGTEEITTHSYGNGGQGKAEAQGEMFTCKAGFIDSSHMRHAGDWTAYFANVLEELLLKGGEIELLYEGGKRKVTIHQFDEKLSKENIIKIAQRMAYDTTVWHEILTWFVPAVIPIFSEKSSSFAPEDNFSNLLGTYVAARALMSGKPYNQAMVEASHFYLDSFEGKDRQTTKEAFYLIADQWYMEKSRIPDPWKTLKRHLNSYPSVTPWQHPKKEVLGCKSNEEIPTLQVPDEITLADGKSLKITDFYEMEVLAHPKIPVAEMLGESLETSSQIVSHRDYPALVGKVGALIRQAYIEEGLNSPDL